MTLDGSVHMPWEGDAQAIVDAVVTFAGEGQRKEASRGHAAETLLRRDGDVWTLRFGGRQVLLKDAKGIGDLARLLVRPERPSTCSRSSAERTRKAVAARIRDAIRRISKVHPEVGAHLDASVATGLCCVYRPCDATRWEVSPEAI